ncbi:autotransporter domain-containing protein [Bradyrhizobium sp. CCGUVB1N3]|uniref:autotransporter outer membrane beta-barrel domain-containing protein n=1 Tax=Bradyrhizobium sp. CCGUVB1N3 TaxID=2949629 RepID=UPI0020B252FB|nr:autotransporter domain-containing protein [Bradyrhizobium sp. CCGUVB1N3]MCP3473883.1 autotransporter domain-containing protein [Bradyrhizobium sp. CCGUVB1N3]
MNRALVRGGFAPRAASLMALLIGSTALTGVALSLVGPAHAGTPDWISSGTGSNDWFIAGNWSPSGVPNATDTVTIDTVSPSDTVIRGATASAQLTFVGAAGTGSLTILNALGTSTGGILNDANGYIGYLANSNGTVNVSGANSAWNNSGTLEVGFGGTGNLTVINGGAVSNTQGLVGVQAGSTGNVRVDGAGSTWSNSGEVYVGSSGTGTVTIANGAAVTSGLDAYLGFSSTGNGTLNVTGAGSSFTVAAGGGNFLTIGKGGTGTMTIANGGSVSNLNASIGSLALSTGTVTVTGAGSTWTNGGGLYVGDAGTGMLNIWSGGKVTSGAARVGYIGGSGSVVVDGAGSTWAAGGLTVGSAGSGMLVIRNGGAVSGTYGVIGLAASGVVAVDGAGSTWSSSSDLYLGYNSNGTLTIANGGAVSVAGAIYVADQAGSTGTLYIGAAPGSAAAAPGTLTASTIQFGAGTGVIVFNHTSSNYVFAPDISGGGSVAQFSGTTILTGNSTYTGSTVVNGGTLSVNGSIGNSATTVFGGGTLGGIGTVGDTTIYGGTLAPGNAIGPNSIGTLTIAGNLVLTTAATYMVQVSGTSASNTVVAGAAQIDGTVVVNLTGRVSSTTTYTILTSANTTGTFGSVSMSNSAYGRNARVSYSGNNVLLTLDPGLLSPSLPGFANINQKNVAAGIDNALLGGGSMTTGFNTLFGATGQNLLNGLTQASGEVATGAQQGTFSAMGQFLNTMLDPFLGNRNDPSEPEGGASRYADDGAATRTNAGRDAHAAIDKARGNSFTQRWNVWAAGYGGSQTTDGNTVVGSNTATSRIAGVAAGADYLISPNTRVGFALGGGGTSFGVANGLGTGSSDLFQAGVYARHTMGNAYVAGALAYGWQDVTTDRTVTIAGVDHLRARFNANALSGRLEGGYRYVTPWMGITPYAAAQFTSFFLPGYGEQAVSGANTFALNYAGRDVTATRSELGLRTDRSYALETALLTLRSRAAWAHDFNPDRAISATFQTLPGASFVVNGAAQAHDATLVTGATELKWLNGFSLSGTFEGEFSNVTRSYTGKGIARYQW